jgi:hypothetical protein
LQSWSIVMPMKSTYMSSATGRMPAIAAPIAVPTMAGFGNRRVAQALGPEFVDQSLGDAIGTAIAAHFLADDEDVLVLGHGVMQRFAERVAIGQFSTMASFPCEHAVDPVCTGSGSGSPGRRRHGTS